MTEAAARPDRSEHAEPANGPIGEEDDPTAPRPWLERIGLAAIAVVMGALFAVVALAASSGGEWILRR